MYFAHSFCFVKFYKNVVMHLSAKQYITTDNMIDDYLLAVGCVTYDIRPLELNLGTHMRTVVNIAAWGLMPTPGDPAARSGVAKMQVHHRRARGGRHPRDAGAGRHPAQAQLLERGRKPE